MVNLVPEEFYSTFYVIYDYYISRIIDNLLIKKFMVYDIYCQYNVLYLCHGSFLYQFC